MPYAPFEMEDESTDSGYTGFDIELLEAIAADLGLTVTVKDLPFDGILGALPTGDCDIVGSAVSITPERGAGALLRVLLRLQAVADGARRERGGLPRPREPRRQDDRRAERHHRRHLRRGEQAEGATVKEYEGGEDLFGALTAGEIDATLQGLPRQRLPGRPGRRLRRRQLGEGEPYGFTMEKDDTALADAVNASLAGLRDEDSTCGEIYTTCFGEAEG